MAKSECWIILYIGKPKSLNHFHGDTNEGTKRNGAFIRSFGKADE
jgi:hypothetical protein